jgi:DNA primase
MGNCPFAPYLHEDGMDKNPSFGIIEGQRSYFNCFACGKSGKLTYLPYLLSQYSGSYSKFLNSFIQANDYSPEIPPQPKKVVLENNEYLWALLAEFDLPQPKLGLYDNKKNIEIWSLRYDPEEKAMVFPIFNEKNELIAVKGRKLGTKKFFHYTEVPLKNAGIWYGMHQKRKKKKIVLVEGERDAILLSYKGVVAWACMGSGITKEQISTLRRLDAEYVLFFDNDKGGERAKELVVEGCSLFNPLYEITNYAGLNDPADIVTRGVLGRVLKSMKKIT